MSKLTELKQKQAQLLKRAREIWDQQFLEERELTAEERTEYENLVQKLEAFTEKIKEERRLAKLEAAFSEDDNEMRQGQNGQGERKEEKTSDEAFQQSASDHAPVSKTQEAPNPDSSLEAEDRARSTAQSDSFGPLDPTKYTEQYLDQKDKLESEARPHSAERSKSEAYGEVEESSQSEQGLDKKGDKSDAQPDSQSDAQSDSDTKGSEEKGDENKYSEGVERTAPAHKENQPNKDDQSVKQKKEQTKSKPDWVLGINEVQSNKDPAAAEKSSWEKDSPADKVEAPGEKETRGNGKGKVSLLSRLHKQREETEISAPGKKGNLGNGVAKKSGQVAPLKKNKQKEGGAQESQEDPYRNLKNKVHRALIDEIDKDVLQKSSTGEKNEELEQEVTETVSRLLDDQEQKLSAKDREVIMEEILNETLGYGPITPLIEDDSITEIMVNGPNQVYVEKDGKVRVTNITFRDAHHVFHVIEKIVAPLGRRIDESSPLVDARLPDGSRVNAIIPPLSLVGPVLTIRKFSRDPLEAKDLVNFGTMSTEMIDFLKTCVQKRLNIVVSGGTGSGKTTTLNVLSSFIPSDERIVTIEDAAELTLHQDHVVTLETRPPNMEGKGAISIRDLVANSLRMRPDRIVVGEVRGGEALDMLQAMNTGHDGSLTTGHSNSPRDMLSRVETMVLMAGMDLPIRAIREQIASAIDLIVHQERMEDGTRKVVNITQVQGMEGDVITMQDLFTFNREGRDAQNRVKGKFESTGFAKNYLNELRKK